MRKCYFCRGEIIKKGFFSILVEGINHQFADGYPKYEISDHQYLRFEVH